MSMDHQQTDENKLILLLTEYTRFTHMIGKVKYMYHNYTRLMFFYYFITVYLSCLSNTNVSRTNQTTRIALRTPNEIQQAPTVEDPDT